jgi:AAA15 family ATPase/GTPase
MPIHSIKIGNFKGIADTQVIPIKPITLFIGENSSGKSCTCILSHKDLLLAFS